MTTDSQRHLDTATAFFLAGERCSLEVKFRGYDFHSVAAPTLVNYALAVELALKLIHELCGDLLPRGHNLRHLFEGLSEEVKSDLPYLAEFVPEIATSFVDWRYPYEREFLMGDYENARRAFIECYKEIRRLAPLLISVYEKKWGSFEPEWVQTWPDVRPRFEMRSATRS